MLRVGFSYPEIARHFCVSKGSLASALWILRRDYPADFPPRGARTAAGRETALARRGGAKGLGERCFVDVAPATLAAESRLLRRQAARVARARERRALAALTGGPGGC